MALGFLCSKLRISKITLSVHKSEAGVYWDYDLRSLREFFSSWGLVFPSLGWASIQPIFSVRNYKQDKYQNNFSVWSIFSGSLARRLPLSNIKIFLSYKTHSIEGNLRCFIFCTEPFDQEKASV
jgi:hypothetical protein